MNFLFWLLFGYYSFKIRIERGLNSLITIEEYIHNRKKEDNLEEWDINARTDNLKICVNYVFEYFNNYLTMTDADEQTALKEEKFEKYRRELRDYTPEVRQWILNVYSENNVRINNSLGNLLKQDAYFFLYNTESEFRSISYDVYAKAIKKYHFMKGQTEQLFLFVKDYHSIKSNTDGYRQFPNISDKMTQWIENTKSKYQVSLFAFAWDWLDYFDRDMDSWPASHRKKCPESYRKYEYDYKQSSNLFNLDSLYRNMPKKPFTRGKKQEFEALLMYIWLWEYVGDSDYWEKYIEKVIPYIESK